MGRFTSVEQWLDDRAHALLDVPSLSRSRAFAVELVAFGAKQAWAALFGGLLIVVFVAARAAYPSDAAIARSDALTIAAVLIQVGMVLGRLETLRELRVIVLFHLVGTVMELFKTGMGSWQYETDGVLHIAAVPLYSGFMYAAVGSYMVRVMRLFDLRFSRYPPIWATAITAVLIYANFFTLHFTLDLRWVLVAAVVVLYARTVMHVRALRSTFRMPVLAAFAGVASVIWLAENVATWAGAWAYPYQVEHWEPVSVTKLVSWFLLMMISVVLVTWVYPPTAPDKRSDRRADGRSAPPLG